MNPSGNRSAVGRVTQRRAWGVGALLLAVALAVQLTSESDGFGSLVGEPARICVVNLEKVFDSAPSRVGMEAGLQAREEEIRAEIDEKRKELEALKGELELIRPDTEEYQRIQREMVQKNADLKFVGEQYEQEMTRRVLEARGQLLEEIDSVVAKVCDQEGFDVVLQREFKIPKTQVTWNTVFFARPSFDITDRVIAELGK